MAHPTRQRSFLGHSEAMSTDRRFPPPWIVEDIGAAFVVKDSGGVFLLRGRASAAINSQTAYERRGASRNSAGRHKPSKRNRRSSKAKRHPPPDCARDGRPENARRHLRRPGTGPANGPESLGAAGKRP